MYHLIVVGRPEAYDEGFITLERGRAIQEYTNAALSKRYSQLSEHQTAELIRFPALFTYERGNKKDARLGWITHIQTRANAVRLVYKFDDSLPVIPWQQIETLEWDLNIDEYEMCRTHWALKDIDLFNVLIEHQQLSEEILSNASPDSALHRYMSGARLPEITSSVFRIPKEPQDERLVSVMMPFDKQFDPVYAAISNVCEELNLNCRRVDDIFEESEVIQDIFSLIYRSAAVVCDLTDRNPNVYYETGIAHTLGKPVVPIAQSDEHVTFDLRHHRFIQYINNSEGLQKLTPRLKKRFCWLFHVQ